jgi:hypothetical protein
VRSDRRLEKEKKWRNGRDTEVSRSEFHGEGGLERRLFVHLKKRRERKKEKNHRQVTTRGVKVSMFRRHVSLGRNEKRNDFLLRSNSET